MREITSLEIEAVSAGSLWSDVADWLKGILGGGSTDSGNNNGGTASAPATSGGGTAASSGDGASSVQGGACTTATSSNGSSITVCVTPGVTIVNTCPAPTVVSGSVSTRAGGGSGELRYQEPCTREIIRTEPKGGN